jgi:DNA-nicking Smr family endonuclease
MSRGRRKLSAEERELWAHVASSAVALNPARTPLSFEPAPKPVTHQTPRKTRPEVKDFRIGSAVPDFAFRHDLAPSLAERLAHAPIRMDLKAHQKMTKGKFEPEARLDLHGMTLAEAHPELIRFVLNAQDTGKRLVLVITGKGKPGFDTGPIPVRQGVLRHQVPQWLRVPPLGAVVLQVAQAHLRHGGSGALYVYLRRGGVRERNG